MHALHPIERSDAIEQAAWHTDRGHSAQALALVNGVLADLGSSPEQAAMAWTLRSRNLYMDGSHEAGADAAYRALTCWRGLSHANGEGAVRAVLARIFLTLGDGDAAREESQLALDCTADETDLGARLLALLASANVDFWLGRLDGAGATCQQALAVAARQPGREPHPTAGSIHDLLACVVDAQAAPARAAGDDARWRQGMERSSHHSRTAIELFRALGHRQNEGSATANLADTLASMGRAEEALALIDSFQLDNARDARFTVSQLHDVRGVICMRLGRFDDAVHWLRDALRYSEGDLYACSFHGHLADACEGAGDLRGALDAHRMFHKLHVQLASDKASFPLPSSLPVGWPRVTTFPCPAKHRSRTSSTPCAWTVAWAFT